ncbi:SDR family oxidoreductase [Solimonas sp. K1W22B-7]|uniref:SDR family oxidoreductase n=1 Tax=Solimonas sp. K1W22B-7 TaxID=2303331 RepID=UPI000E32DE93|nr:SDR family oxidoreductase [Solimonas sp. K1W22B-7]AXQ28242.1 SDR family oxidoreductase [Solimonas sp. K1W22B-7]
MKPRTILITGCSSGIGRALALELQARGLAVWATARRPETLKDLEDRGIRCAALDVDSPDSIAALAARLDSEGVALDVLVNNAGYGAMGPLAEMPAAELRRQFDTNVLSLMALTQALLPPMMRRRSGMVVNLGSVSGVLVTPFSGAYCATKAAVHALSDALRMELAPFGIHVMTVQPGAIQSQFGATATAGIAARGVSAYAAVADAVMARAGASQQHSTTAEKFARVLADAMLARRPAAQVRIGNGSRAMPLVKRLVPTGLLDWVLRKKFRLDQPL